MAVTGAIGFLDRRVTRFSIELENRCGRAALTGRYFFLKRPDLARGRRLPFPLAIGVSPLYSRSVVIGSLPCHGESAGFLLAAA